MNWPNRLTIGRLFLSVAFVAILSSPTPYRFSWALAFFIVASVTDYIDGLIARRYGLVTDFGRLMDPLVDKIMMAAAFICLVPEGAIPAWAATVIVSREFLITGLRLLALSKGRVLSAEALGKHKTAWQIATIIFFLALLAISETGGFGTHPKLSHWYQWLWNPGGTLLISVAVALTLISGAGYLWKNRALIEMT